MSTERKEFNMQGSEVQELGSEGGEQARKPEKVECGELRAADAGRFVQLNGWVHRRRDQGALIFIDLRDRRGLTQVVFNQETNPEAHRLAEQARPEFVLR